MWSPKCMVDGCGVVVWYTYFKVHVTKDHPEIPQHRNIRKQYGRQVEANDQVLEDVGVADLHPLPLLKSVLKYRLEGETTVCLLLALCRKSGSDPKAVLQSMINEHEADEDYAFSPPMTPVSLPSSGLKARGSDVMGRPGQCSATEKLKDRV
ncbi:hypothetical protein B5M09_014042 [Aphanomyces astaci]|uniref:Uncharacterized protein n=1 Tax=Aphanomyces astaci TaxID=112090 RepID=A0A3R7WDL6_APHAT|nr:hypothetical protein B5M09_014042 [Aphanomyces astaci]